MSNGPFDKDDEWPRLTALYYDPEEAARYISERTGVQFERARSFIIASDRYELLLGTAPIYEDEDDVQEIMRARAEHADLLPLDADALDYHLLLTYVQRTTEFTTTEVATMIAENVGYYVKQNIMEPEAYEDVRGWADEIMITTPPQ